MSAEMTLPATWIVTKLDNVTNKIVGGGTPSKNNPKYFEGNIPWMSVKDMNKHILDDTQDHISEEAVLNSSTNIIPAGIPIIATRMSLGKVIIAKFDSAINQDLKAIYLNDAISISYFTKWYRSVAKYIESLGTGTTVKGIRLENIKELDFPLTSLAEQHQIAQRLDELLAQVDTIKARLDAIPAILKRFRQSVLSAAVSGKLTEEWRKGKEFGTSYTIGMISTDIRYGTSKKCDSQIGQTPVLRIPNIGNGYIDLNDLKYADFEQTELNKLQLKKNDILVIRSNGSVELVGKPAIIDEKSIHCLFAGYLIRIRFNQDIVVPKYVLYCLQCPETRKTIEIQARSTSGVNNINSKEISNLSLLLPKIEEQEEIVRRVDQLFTFSDQITQRVNDAKNRVDKLTQSILAKAFRGELTADWRAEHPELINGENSAEALLAKIKAAKAALDGKKTRKKTS